MLRLAQFTAIAAVLMPCAAQAAPQQLLKKSIAVSYAHYLPAKGADGSTNTTPRNVAMTIYVSELGRIFAKSTARAANYSTQKAIAPDAGRYIFSGDKIVATFPQASGAVQLIISFDPSFKSCKINLVAGKETGKPYVWVGLSGVTYTATGPSEFTNTACSISEGNAVAN